MHKKGSDFFFPSFLFFYFIAGWQSAVPNLQNHIWGKNRHAASWEDGVPRHPSLPARLQRLQNYSDRLRHSCRNPGLSTSARPNVARCGHRHHRLYVRVLCTLTQYTVVFYIGETCHLRGDHALNRNRSSLSTTSNCRYCC